MTTISIEMPVFCFDVLLAQLNKHPAPKIPLTIPDKNFPIFVTWKKGHHRQLRGCIGTFSRSMSLHESLIEYAVISAFRDSRFDPVSLHEIPHLHCSVSLLVSFEQITHYKDWVIGVHGIRIDFKQYHRSLSAVYLPEVAHEQGWDHVETMDNLMRKGGFKGPISEDDRLSVFIERFQSEKKTISYEDYLVHKKKYEQQLNQIGHVKQSGGFFPCLP